MWAINPRRRHIGYGTDKPREYIRIYSDLKNDRQEKALPGTSYSKILNKVRYSQPSRSRYHTKLAKIDLTAEFFVFFHIQCTRYKYME